MVPIFASPPHTQLPSNNCLGSCVDAIACTWEQYGKKSACVLFVVQNGERNIFDQRPFEFELWKRYKIPVVRKTLSQLSEEAALGQDRELLVSGQEVAVVYYRAGYTPRDYPSDKVSQSESSKFRVVYRKLAFQFVYVAGACP